MKIQTLLEATSEDLFRKLDALDAMINDPSTTQGEKDNARSAKEKIAAKLAKEFPNATRPSKSSSNTSGMSKGEYDFWSGMAKAAQAHQEKEDLKKNDPEEYRRVMRQELESMKSRLKILKKNHLPGNVDTAYRIKTLSQKIEDFIAREFPEEYKEIIRKREDANYKAFLARSKKAREKEKAEKDKLKKSGMAKIEDAAKEHSDSVKKLYDNLLGVKINTSWGTATVGEGYLAWNKRKAGGIMTSIVNFPMGKVREAWNKLDSETQEDLRTCVSKINTMGYSQNGYTEVQKNKILAAMTPYAKKK